MECRDVKREAEHKTPCGEAVAGLKFRVFRLAHDELTAAEVFNLHETVWCPTEQKAGSYGQIFRLYNLGTEKSGSDCPIIAKRLAIGRKIALAYELAENIERRRARNMSSGNIAP